MRITPLVELLVVGLFLPALAWAQTTNNGTAVVAQTASQFGAAVTADGAGGLIVTWEDTRAGSSDIYAQRLNAQGQTLWTINGVRVCGAASTQTAPQIVSDGQNGAVICWQDYRNGSADIYVQRLNGSGVSQWAVDGVALCSSTNEQTLPMIASDGANGGIVAWQDTRNGGTDIFAQRVTSAGTPAWTVNGVAIVIVGNEQIRPTVVPDGSGGAIVTWEDYRAGIGDIYSQRLNASGVTQWTSNGFETCIASGTQQHPVASSDGLGGVVVAWEDYRNGPLNIYSQRLNGNGVPIWTANGVALCTTAASAASPVIVSDGSGAALVAWQDQRLGSHIYAQMVSAGGLPQWTGNGVPVCTAAGSQLLPSVASVGSGSAVVSWYDSRNGTYDIYAQKISASGAPVWTIDGLRACEAPDTQQEPKVVSDGAGGAIVAWSDYRYVTAPDLFSQRFMSNGDLAFPDSEFPRLVSVRDVPNDQGQRVKLSWKASNQDFPPFNRILNYWIWRSVPSQVAEARIRDGAQDAKDSTEPQPGSLRVTNVDGVDYFWEFLASQPSGHLENYSYVAATTSDSVAGSNPLTAFMVEAVAASAWWYSNPDSGYSVDNLAPTQPQPFTANYLPNGVALHWGVNGATDLQSYRLYRGETPDFEIDPHRLIAAPADTGFFDATGSGLDFYRLTAVDVHGNESASALVGPGPTTSVDPHGVPLRIASVYPNPARSGRMKLSFRLTEPGPARLELYDIRGRRVEVMDLSALDSGEHTVAFESHAPAGVYQLKLVERGSSTWSRVSIVR